MKNCSKCKKEKEVSFFNKNKNICKVCEKERNTQMGRTKIGLISRIYTDQKQSCKKRNMAQPSYTKDELIMFATNSSNFDNLFLEWTKSGYKTLKRPSVDRINDEKSYTLDNIQIVTFRKNLKNLAANRQKGIDNRVNKAIIQYDVHGTQLNEFHSVHEAARQVGGRQSNISAVLHGKLKTSSGYIWKFK